MVRLQVDLMILKVFSHLSNYMILWSWNCFSVALSLYFQVRLRGTFSHHTLDLLHFFCLQSLLTQLLPKKGGKLVSHNVFLVKKKYFIQSSSYIWKHFPRSVIWNISHTVGGSNTSNSNNGKLHQMDGWGKDLRWSYRAKCDNLRPYRSRTIKEWTSGHSLHQSTAPAWKTKSV